MLNKRYPFETTESLMFNEMPKLNENISEKTCEFLSKLLNKNSLERINSKTIRNDSYFDDFDWNKLENGQLKPPIKFKASSPTDISYIDSKITSKSINYKDFGAEYKTYKEAMGLENLEN